MSKQKVKTTVWEGSEEARKWKGLRREQTDTWRITNLYISKTNAVVATGEEQQIQHKICKFSWVCPASLELSSPGSLLHAFTSFFTKEISNVGGLAVCCNFVDMIIFHLLVCFIPHIEPALSFKIKMWNVEWELLSSYDSRQYPRAEWGGEGNMRPSLKCEGRCANLVTQIISLLGNLTVPFISTWETDLSRDWRLSFSHEPVFIHEQLEGCVLGERRSIKGGNILSHHLPSFGGKWFAKSFPCGRWEIFSLGVLRKLVQLSFSLNKPSFSIWTSDIHVIMLFVVYSILFS